MDHHYHPEHKISIKELKVCRVGFVVANVWRNSIRESKRDFRLAVIFIYTSDDTVNWLDSSYVPCKLFPP